MAAFFIFLFGLIGESWAGDEARVAQYGWRNRQFVDVDFVAFSICAKLIQNIDKSRLVDRLIACSSINGACQKQNNDRPVTGMRALGVKICNIADYSNAFTDLLRWGKP